MKSKNSIDKVIKNNYVNIADIAICICLFVMAIYKGSFYKQDMLFPNLVVTITGVIYVIIKLIKEVFKKKEKVKKHATIYNILGLFIIALPIAYFMPILFGRYSSLSNSIYEMLRYVNFCIIYYIVKESKIQNLYIKCIAAISVLFTILGIDQMTFRIFEPILNSISTGYLYEDKDRLSATIQYANITGIIILIGYIFISMKAHNLSTQYINSENKVDVRMKKNKLTEKVKILIKLLICAAILTCQVIAIILTNSRLIIALLILSNIVILIYIVLKKQKVLALIQLAIFISGFIVSGDVILNISMGNYGIVYKNILIAVILSNVLVYIFTNYSARIFLSAIKNNLIVYIKNNKIVAIISAILVVFVSIYILTLGKPLSLKFEKTYTNEIATESKSTDTIRVSQDLYGFKEGINRLEIDILENAIDSRYIINILGLTDKYKQNTLETINYFDKTQSKHIKEFNIDKNIRRLILNIEVRKGDITFENVLLNNKKQKLAYMFLPSKVVSKFKETYTIDNSSKLRYDYFIDSIKIWKGSKLIGFGGEAFKYKYGEVQSYPYISTEAHSCLMQTLVEAGIFGAVIMLGIIISVLYMSIYIVIKQANKKSIYLLLSIISILIICIFDLALSFGIMIYILAIFAGIISKEYSDSIKGKLAQSNSYFKIAKLSFVIVCLIPVTYFSINIYRASLIKVQSRIETLTSEEYIIDIGMLERKISLDKYDPKYITAVIGKYEEYKKALTSSYYLTGDEKQRSYIKEETTKSIMKIKENIDILVNNEYSDKYILELGAKIYFTNFINFSNIYKEQFKDKEIAYAVYLGYALKLTDRINEIAKYSSKSREMSMELYKHYLEELTRQNDIIQSESVANICNLLKIRIKELE